MAVLSFTRETIMLAAHFQLPSSLTTADKEA
jgi:hypothetical protein